MLFHLQTDYHADCPVLQKLLSVDSLCLWVHVSGCVCAKVLTCVSVSGQKVMQNVSHLSLNDWLNLHCCSSPFSPPSAFQPLPPAGGISDSSGSPPAKRVGAVSVGQGKADWVEGSLAGVEGGLKEAQEGRRSPRPLLVRLTLLLILAAFWTLSDDRG